MKKILILSGGVLVFLAIVPIIQYLFENNGFSVKGEGYFWGNVLLLLLGSLLLYKGIRRNKKPDSEDY